MSSNFNMNNFNMNNFNELVNQASDTIMCNSDCQQQRESDKLQQIYLKAQTNIVSAPSELQVAQKNYVTFTQGESAYNEMQEQQLQQQAQIIVNQTKQKVNEEATKIQTQIETYNGLFLNYSNVFDLYTKYKRENVELLIELKDETNDVLTNERKTYYEDQQINSLKFYYYYFLLTVYIICVISFGIFSLMYPLKSTIKTKIIIFILLIILPFISTFILGKIIFLIYELYNLLPKNVYQ
jgi:hypothetical protein